MAMSATVSYLRLYADPAGESHFERAFVETFTRSFAPPAPAFNVSAFVPALRNGFLLARPNGSVICIHLRFACGYSFSMEKWNSRPLMESAIASGPAMPCFSKTQADEDIGAV